MTALRFVSLGIVAVAGIDGWRRVLRPSLNRSGWLAADAGLLVCGVVLALFARFAAIFWVVLLVITFPLFFYAWSPLPVKWTREKTKPPTQRSTQTKATKLAIWVSLLAVVIFFLAGVAGLVWGSLSTVARTGVLLILAVISSAMVVLAWKARRSSADN
jgi:hypothetical protein